MHYYDFHIADYRKDTQHLSPIEHYIYRSLIDWYFLDEAPITENNPTVIRRLSLGSTPDAEVLINGVFADFFELKDGFWHHHRIDSMLADYRARTDVNRQNGKKGGRPPKKEAETPKIEPKETQSVNFANPTESESNPNQEPRTKNQQPRTKNQQPTNRNEVNTWESAIADAPAQKPKTKSKSAPIQKPDGVDQAVWDDWLLLRKNKGAAVTQTVVSGAEKEAEKAGISLNDFFAEWCFRGSQGLKAEWLRDKQGAMPSSSGEIGGLKLGPAGSKTLATMYERAARKAAEQNTFDL